MSVAPLHRGVARDPFIGRVLAGRFKVVERIGEGGMSRIYKAESTESGGETVAVKVLHGYLQRREEAVLRFQREVKAASSIGHPGIITVLESGKLPDGTVYMIQELLKGEDWSDVLDRSGAQPIGHAVGVIRKVCDGVGAAHAKGIIHRDLKPANVFLHERKSGRIVVKVLDFGVSKIRDDEQTLTATDSTMGTVAYMSPEQLRGAKLVDARSDIWALGVMLYEALAGHKPFEAETMAMTATKIFNDATPRIRHVRPDVPSGLHKTIHKMLQKNPDKRYQTCAEVKEALAPFLNLETTAVVQDAPEERFGKIAYAGIAVAVVALVGGIWWSLAQPNPATVELVPEAMIGSPPTMAAVQVEEVEEVEEVEAVEEVEEIEEVEPSVELNEPDASVVDEEPVESMHAQTSPMRARMNMRPRPRMHTSMGMEAGQMRTIEMRGIPIGTGDF